MPNKFQRREIGKNIFFSSVNDPRFKFNTIAINFLIPLSEETASDYALVSRILATSCTKYPSLAKLSNKLSSLYAAQLNGAATSLDDLQNVLFSIQYLDNRYALENEKVEEEAVDILLNCLFEPVLEKNIFPEKTFSIERQNLIIDIEAEINDKQSYAGQRARQIMYKGEPAAVRSLGSVEQAKRATPVTVFNAYKRLLRNARIEIICSGCSDFGTAEKIISAAFSKLIKTERGEIFPCKTKKSPLKETVEKVTEEMQVAQTKLVIGFKTDCENDSALHMMSAVYGGTSTSKLFLNVREKMSLCYYCWSGINKNKGSMFVSCGVEKENVEKAVDEILAQLEKMKNGEFSDDDVEYAKMYRKNNLQTYNDSYNMMGVWYLLCIYNDDIKSPEDAVRESDAVTREEIVEAARSVKLDTIYVLTSPNDGKE